MSERNRVAGQKWQESDSQEKMKYQQLAAQLPTVSVDENCDKWHETRRVLKNMQENVCILCYIISIIEGVFLFLFIVVVVVFFVCVCVIVV